MSIRGKVLPDTILSIAEELAVEEPEEIALVDTIGVGTPSEVSELFGRLSDLLKDKIPMRAHFHNTYGTGIANAWAAYQVGVLTFDASIGGLGGCPFAPNATGNIATEDLIYMLERSGIQTGVEQSEYRYQSLANGKTRSATTIDGRTRGLAAQLGRTYDLQTWRRCWRNFY